MRRLLSSADRRCCQPLSALSTVTEPKGCLAVEVRAAAVGAATERAVVAVAEAVVAVGQTARALEGETAAARSSHRHRCSTRPWDTCPPSALAPACCKARDEAGNIHMLKGGLVWR